MFMPDILQSIMSENVPNMERVPVGEIAFLCDLIEKSNFSKRFRILQDIVVCKDDVTDVDRGSKYKKTRGD